MIGSSHVFGGLAALACMLPLATGCNKAIPREAVSGSVTLDGKPLEKGSLLFTPLDEGPSANGEIKDGSYQLPKERGPSLGKYRVEIVAYREIGKSTRNPSTGAAESISEPIIPSRYNQNSELQVEVVTNGNNRFDFELHSR